MQILTQEKFQAVLEAERRENERVFDVLASKVPGGRAAVAKEVQNRRRAEATSSDGYSGIWVKKDNAGLMLGPDADVQFVRSGEREASLHADVVVNGTLIGAAQDTSGRGLRACVGHSPHEDWLQYVLSIMARAWSTCFV